VTRKNELFRANLKLIERVIFSRSLRVLPLPQQVGVVEGLATIIKTQPSLLPLSDQHLVLFLQELLKMLSVADGEMIDPHMKDRAVNKDGFVTTTDLDNSYGNAFGVYASSIFVQRECVLKIDNKKFVVSQEFRTGVQLRKSTIQLMRSIVLSYREQFFEAEWIGKC
jgi:transformation/transcription domain-associated protein